VFPQGGLGVEEHVSAVPESAKKHPGEKLCGFAGFDDVFMLRHWRRKKFCKIACPVRHDFIIINPAAIGRAGA
jgi:hypothetical protein